VRVGERVDEPNAEAVWANRTRPALRRVHRSARPVNASSSCCSASRRYRAVQSVCRPVLRSRRRVTFVELNRAVKGKGEWRVLTKENAMTRVFRIQQEYFA